MGTSVHKWAQMGTDGYFLRGGSGGFWLNGHKILAKMVTMVTMGTKWAYPFPGCPRSHFLPNSGEFFHKMVKKDTDGKFLSKKKG